MGVKSWLGLKKLPEGSPSFVSRWNARKSRAQLFQDLWALSETHNKRSGFFVEIGAFDGVTLSNSYLLEKRYGWSGILAEPNPAFADKIRAARTVPLCTLPVDDVSGKDITMMFVSDFPELSSMQENAVNDHLADHRKNSRAVIQRTVSLNDLLTEYKAPRDIDFISIDTEGNEPDILSTFAFDRYRVGLFCVEHNFTEAEAKLDLILLSKGYHRVHREWSQWDAWYRHS